MSTSGIQRHQQEVWEISSTKEVITIPENTLTEQEILKEVVFQLIKKDGSLSTYLSHTLEADTTETIGETQQALWTILILNQHLNQLSEDQRKIIHFFLQHPWETFTKTEIAKNIWVSSSGLRRELEKLQDQEDIMKNSSILTTEDSYRYYSSIGSFPLDEISEKTQIQPWLWYIPDRKSLYSEGKLDYLGNTWSKLLEFFISHLWKIYSKQEILDHVWKNNLEINQKIVDIYIYKLRTKNISCIKSCSWLWYYLEKGRLDVNKIKNKITLSEGVVFLPDLYMIHTSRSRKNLTRAEFFAFNKIVSHPGRIFSKGQLDFSSKDDTKSVKVYFAKVRKKLNLLQEWLWDNIKNHHWEWYSRK